MKEPVTPKSQIVSQLRQLWLRSRERAEAMKLSGYCCVHCGVKKSASSKHPQKLDVHHKDGVLNWDEIVGVIREQLLCSPIKLEPLCPNCHDKITYGL